MMSPRLLHRVQEHLDTLMAQIRPLPSERHSEDFSYRLNEDAFIVDQHRMLGESPVLTAQAILKIVHSEKPEGWLLYALDVDGHWQPHADMVFTAELLGAISAVRNAAGLNSAEHPLNIAN